MGTLMGHVVPGTYFIAFSLWWTWCVLHRFFYCEKMLSQSYNSEDNVKRNKKRRIRYQNIFSFSPQSGFCSRYSVEGIVKIVSVFLGMTGEFICAFEDGKFVHLHNAQHMTMFFFFGMSGAVDVLQRSKKPVPQDLDYVTGILALSMEALMFYFHLHGRSPMDVQVHMLLFYSIVAAAIAAAFEMRYRNNVLPALARVYFVMLQGTWFFQVGFILYPPIGAKWDQTNHHQMLIVTLLFAWHSAAIFIFLLLAGIFIYFKVRRTEWSDVFSMPFSHEDFNRHLNVQHELCSRDWIECRKYDTESLQKILESEDDDDVL